MVSIPKKVVEYEAFVNEKLRPDLAAVELEAEKVCDELSNFLQIVEFIKQLKSKTFGDGPIKTQTDLGCNFYVQCVM